MTLTVDVNPDHSSEAASVQDPPLTIRSPLCTPDVRAESQAAPTYRAGANSPPWTIELFTSTMGNFPARETCLFLHLLIRSLVYVHKDSGCLFYTLYHNPSLLYCVRCPDPACWPLGTLSLFLCPFDLPLSHALITVRSLYTF